MAQWVSGRYGASRYKAQRMIEAGHSLKSLPRISSALGTGRLDLDRVLELARLATPETERQLISWARRVTPQWIRHKADLERREAAREAKRADRGRFLQWSWEGDTTLSVYGSLTAEQGAAFVKAIDKAADEVPVSPVDDPANIEARRADALTMLVAGASAGAGESDHATVLVHVPLEALTSKTRCAEIAGLDVALHPSVTKRLCCDARIQPVITGEGGKTVAMGTESYQVPRWLRRAVLHRDEYRCTHPGCHMKRFVDVHHIVVWPLGPTELDNLVTVCRFHHKLVHEHNWRVRLIHGVVRWFRPNGDPYDPAPVLARAGPSG